MNDYVNTATEARSELLLLEMQHRMKNYLQLILSLINNQLNENNSDGGNLFLQSLKEKIFVISSINDNFDYSQDNRKLNLGRLLKNIVIKVEASFQNDKQNIFIRKKN
jgi:two-component sensor histidine kinase